jgi:hypothetical protein
MLFVPLFISLIFFFYKIICSQIDYDSGNKPKAHPR